MGRNPKVTTLIIQQINKLYAEGYTMVDIGKKVNLGHSTVCNYIWQPRSRGTVRY